MNIVRVEPDNLLIRAAAQADELLVCSFREPLTAARLQQLVRELTADPSAGTPANSSEVREVTPTPSVTDSTALSLAALELHTDGAFMEFPPPRFLLSCTREDPAAGGTSTFVSARTLAEQAPTWALDALSTASYRFLKTYDGDLTTAHDGAVLTTSPDGTWRIRWRADHLYLPAVVEPRGTRAENAAKWLCEHLRAVEPCEYLLRRGEVAIVPNAHVLHGRRALSRGSRRSLLRAWVF